MYSVLYVDDEEALLEIGKLFLEQNGRFTVDVITSATEGLALLKTKNYEAIISDYQMPDMDGIEFLKQVRAAHGSIPFILFTGRGREEVVIEAINNGVDFYLQKGGDPKSQFIELGHKIGQAVQRRRAETAIRDLERRQADIINFLPDATFAIDTAGVVIAWNRAMEELTGVPAAEIRGKGNFEHANVLYHERRAMLADMVLAPDGQRGNGKAQYTIHPDGSVTGEARIPRPDGTTMHVWGKASRLFDERGILTGAIESIRDVTERIRAEAALKESEERLRSIIYSMQIGVVIVEVSTHRILDVNDKALELMSREKSEVIGAVCHRFICPAESGKCPVTDLGQTVDCSDRLLLNREGEKIPILKSVIRTTLDGKDVLVESFQDISGSRRAENELRQAYEQIAAADKELHLQYDELKKSQQTFHESEEKYRLIVENTRDIIYTLNPSGALMYISPSQAGILGYNPSDLAGRSFLSLIHSEDVPLAREAFHRSLEESYKSTGTECRVRHASGAWRWFSTKGETVRDEAGNPRYFTGIATDIHERREMETALRKSEEKYRSIVEASPDVIWEIDERGNFTAISSQSGRYLGYTPEELIGKSFINLVRPESRDGIMKVFTDQARAKTPSIMLEVPAMHKDGHPLVVEIRSIQVRDESGAVTGARGVATDITERKRVEQEMLFKNAILSTEQEISIEGILIVDEHAKILSYNRKFVEIWGIPKDIQTGDTDDPVLQYVAGQVADTEGFLARVKYLYEHKSEKSFEELFLKDGRILERFSAPMVGGTGIYYGRVWYFRDMTLRRREENALHLANRKLKLLSGITRHDINNQLTILKSHLILLQNQLQDPTHSDQFRKITVTTERIALMIQFTREYEEIGVQVPVWQDLRQIIEEATAQIHTGGVTVENILPAGSEVLTDPLIARVFYNLMDNAIRYGGKITTIRFSVEHADGHWIIVCEDDGDGIAAGEKEKIFERGFGKNTGLGLFLAREILSITGITIRETGEPGQGARFEIVLPNGCARIPGSR